ncbi:Hypothetical protein NTJ_09997 [Nesidiocoris tenuis]|uniref:Uncharacterized protein n=1 Tax=Nesidiocoris tenuis TaxID=355587 RepID=A0ABN7AYD3_9HEMI|nr:Hypothetical protein NTJ_09997 [Nesidiocoris tenuis]
MFAISGSHPVYSAVPCESDCSDVIRMCTCDSPRRGDLLTKIRPVPDHRLCGTVIGTTAAPIVDVERLLNA